MGSSSRTASTNSTTDNTFSNVDNRVTSDGGILGGNTTLNASDTQIGGNISISNTDYGAVSGGLGVALAALDSNTTGFSQTLEAIQDTNKLANQQTLQAIDRSFALAGESTRSEAATALQDFMKWSAMVLLGGGALYLLVKKFT